VGALRLNPRDEIGGKELRQLQIATSPRAIAPYLEEVYRDQGTVGCHILDVKYEPGLRCAILYQLGGRLVLGTLGWSEPRHPLSGAARSIDALEMQTYLFPHDPALPGLARAFDPEDMKQVLTAALPACRAGEMRILRCRATLLRYRPTRRCTLRLDLSLVDCRTGVIVPGVLYGKLYHDLAKAAAVFADMQMLSVAGALGDDLVAVAAPAAFVADLAMILQEPLVGTPLEALLARRATRAVERVAQALASVHAAKLETDRHRPVVPALRRMAQRASAIGMVDRRLGGRMVDLVDALLSHTDGLDVGARSLLHGDCKPSQFLVGERVAILDFDHAGMGDPACDIGDFTATLRQLSAREAVRARAARVVRPDDRLHALEERFLAAYTERDGSDPGLPERVPWYRAFALLRKAIRGFQRSPRSPLPAMLVDEAWRCLETGPRTTRSPVLVSAVEQG
jgi:aminoglycoside phosphotransferase (APT) family kinase protein